ncbi:hypothetical protein [Primorskyibacter flagellatus]|uniref:Peptidoglycan binding-like domain-containing protein n=1 Tax=Primorskyibacter flagellatus TaxID=1387277 RepID=A0A1W2ET71_9RHOB|nr:hypothetical protein [Primorskyibacter flagellatus]SMD12835.1 hypothetical protein SAMN06295998_1433 [Primorskyibacter flagellatus]
MLKYYLAAFFFFLATLASAQDAEKDAFFSLSNTERQRLQSSLEAAGLYRSEIDGLWGPATNSALTVVAERLSEVGIYYDLQTEQSAKALYTFLLSEPGYYFLVPEGAECDGCDSVLAEATGADTGAEAGVFVPVSSNAFGSVKLEEVTYFTGRTGICRADLGSFSDGSDVLEVSAWRRYDGWGFDILSDRNIAPPLLPPDPFQGDVLLMNGTFERNGERWISSFVNGNTNFMDQLENQAAIQLSASQGNSSILIKIPNLPQVISDFRQCAQIEERQHWQKFCLETIPSNMRDPDFTPQCVSYWR